MPGGGDFEASCSITVIDVPQIVLDPQSATLTPGGTLQIEATVTPETDAVIVWKSSDEGIATVDNGAVEALATGTATITATLTVIGREFEGKCELTVKEPDYAIGQIVEFGGVKGIVFSVSEDGTSGKAVSFTERLGLLWGTQDINCNASSETDGEENTRKIKDIGLEYHPAAKWCTDLGEGWYMPAVDEGIEFVTKATILNPILTANGGTSIKDSAYDWYWSSTEGESDPESEVLCFYGGTSGGHSYGDFKRHPEYDNLVRAVHKF